MEDLNDFGGLFGNNTPAKKEAEQKDAKSLSPSERIQKFFSEVKPQSIVKTKIVASYYSRWADVMVRKNAAQQLGYIDLFCGPGIYGDAYESTPIQILKRTINFPELAERLVATFNDEDEDFVESLKTSAATLPGFEKLRHVPKFLTETVSDHFIAEYEKIKLHPTLIFLDPCGYKGLSVRLMQAVLKDFGCDLIFFFNYNRVNMHLQNKSMDENINALFGTEWAGKLKNILKEERDPAKREEIILQILKNALAERGGKFFLPFRFREGNKTTHFIVLVSKHYRAYAIMKEMMKPHSIVDPDGVPYFEYNTTKAPIHHAHNIGQQLSFFDAAKEPVRTRLQLLCNYLYKEFNNRTLTVKEVFERHNVGTPYILKNYKDAIRILEEMRYVSCDRRPETRPNHTIYKIVDGETIKLKQVTVADDLRVTFKKVKKEVSLK